MPIRLEDSGGSGPWVNLAGSQPSTILSSTNGASYSASNVISGLNLSGSSLVEILNIQAPAGKKIALLRAFIEQGAASQNLEFEIEKDGQVVLTKPAGLATDSRQFVVGSIAWEYTLAHVQDLAGKNFKIRAKWATVTNAKLNLIYLVVEG